MHMLLPNFCVSMANYQKKHYTDILLEIEHTVKNRVKLARFKAVVACSICSILACHKLSLAVFPFICTLIHQIDIGEQKAFGFAYIYIYIQWYTIRTISAHAIMINQPCVCVYSILFECIIQTHAEIETEKK